MSKKISGMNQDELINHARTLENDESGRTFEESVEYWRSCGDEEKAAEFSAMVTRWWELEDCEKTLGSLTVEEARDELIPNNLDWYVVEYTDGSFDLKNRTGLSSILDCGDDPADYDIAKLHQCWNGDDLGECPF